MKGNHLFNLWSCTLSIKAEHCTIAHFLEPLLLLTPVKSLYPLCRIKMSKTVGRCLKYLGRPALSSSVHSHTAEILREENWNILPFKLFEQVLLETVEAFATALPSALHPFVRITFSCLLVACLAFHCCSRLEKEISGFGSSYSSPIDWNWGDGSGLSSRRELFYFVIFQNHIKRSNQEESIDSMKNSFTEIFQLNSNQIIHLSSSSTYRCGLLIPNRSGRNWPFF